jgi:hypothetical protein
VIFGESSTLEDVVIPDVVIPLPRTGMDVVLIVALRRGKSSRGRGHGPRSLI